MPRTKLAHYKSQTAMRFRHPSDHLLLEMTPPFLLSHPDYLDGVSTTHTAPTHQPFSCPKAQAQVLHSPLLANHRNPNPWAILGFMVALISSILKRAVLLRLRAFVSTCFGLTFPQPSLFSTADRLWSFGWLLMFIQECLGEILGPLPLVQFLMS